MVAASLVVLLLLVASAAVHALGSFKDNCLYFSHQNQHEVMIYKPSSDKTVPSKPYGKVFPNKNPTGLAIRENVLYVASYGDLRTQPTGITKYDTQDYLKSLGPFKTGPELERCFPEGLAIDGEFLYVGCGVAQNAAILKYNIITEEFVGVLAKGLPAVFGVTVKGGYVYFSSHCTSETVRGELLCNLFEHDKVFRVPIDGPPEKMTPFAHLPSESDDGDWQEAGFTGLSFAPNGNLYVASKRKDDVKIFNPLGGYEGKVKLRHNERTSDVIFGPDGWAYVGNPGRGRIIRFNPGSPTDSDVFASPGPDIVDSKITYLLWAKCPRLRVVRDEL